MINFYSVLSTTINHFWIIYIWSDTAIHKLRRLPYILGFIYTAFSTKHRLYNAFSTTYIINTMTVFPSYPPLLRHHLPPSSSPSPSSLSPSPAFTVTHVCTVPTPSFGLFIFVLHSPVSPLGVKFDLSRDGLFRGKFWRNRLPLTTPAKTSESIRSSLKENPSQ